MSIFDDKMLVFRGVHKFAVLDFCVEEGLNFIHLKQKILGRPKMTKIFLCRNTKLQKSIKNNCSNPKDMRCIKILLTYSIEPYKSFNVSFPQKL
jgi:hypothetical protein